VEFTLIRHLSASTPTLGFFAWHYFCDSVRVSGHIFLDLPFNVAAEFSTGNGIKASVPNNDQDFGA
jgi:hypothetical protein